MASVHRVKASRYWHGAFTLPDGRRVLRSTRMEKKGKAMQIALMWEKAAKDRMAESQIRRVFSDIHEAIHGRPLASAKVCEYAGQWLARKSGEVGKSTLQAYRIAVNDFLAVMGDRAGADLLSVTTADVVKARDAWAKEVAPKTVNNKLKAIRAMFSDAWRDGIIPDNAAAKVPALKCDSAEGRAFTLDEIKNILAHAKDEWRGMVLGGLYTGQRLVDLAMMRWNQIDLVNRQLTLKTRKTGRRIILPIAQPFYQWLGQHAGDDPNAPLFPKLAEKAEGGGSAPLSQLFHNLLSDADLATKRKPNHQSNGTGRRGYRQRNELTFHALRHTATTWLKMGGVPEAVARDIIGHSSAEVSRLYTHVDEASKAAALAKLPDVTAGAESK